LTFTGQELKQLKCVSGCAIRKLIHIAAERRGWIARTWYEQAENSNYQYSVRCDTCKQRTLIEPNNTHNACCGDDMRSCSCEVHYAICGTKDCPGEDDYGWGRIYFNPIGDYFDKGKCKTNSPFVPTGKMIVYQEGTPYKHLNTRSGSYRRAHNK